MKNEKILKKIKALLSKTTENGASEQEAIIALNKANELMLEHYITEFDLKDVEEAKLITIEVPLFKTAYDLSLLYDPIAKMFDCMSYYNSERVAFFGFEDDVTLCDYFYNTITKACFKEKDVFQNSKKYRDLKRYGYHGKTIISDFIKGFIESVSYKMYLMYKNRKSSIPVEKGLVVLEKEQKVKFEFDNLSLKLKKARVKDLTYSTEAFHEGSEKGEVFNIHQPLTSQQSNQNVLALI